VLLYGYCVGVRSSRQLKRRPQEAPNPGAVANATDPDSRFLHTRTGTVQGYNAQAVTTMRQVIVAAEPSMDGKPSASGSDGLRAAMTAKLASEAGKARYAKRRETVEPAFGQIKEQQGARRFLRRGRRAQRRRPATRTVSRGSRAPGTVSDMEARPSATA
jgi:Transposase DDE domain